MSTKESKIDELIIKYFDGETSLEEENELKEFFNQSEIPERYEKFVSHFKFIDTESKEFLSDDFDDVVSKRITQTKIHKTNFIYKIGYGIAAVAAVIAILMMAYVQYSSLPFKSLRLDYLSQDTYKDPNLAYAETKKTLLYVSSEMNKGMAQLEKLSKFDKSINELEKLSDFNKYQSMIFKGDKNNEN
ncbi:MAG: hypothetical protein A2X61_03275 [Ignavibacteria bacterium GWB2_35_12]|nr:MAG: hypothetical protein A2X63_05355 [Ignavibacteria bacterium GWA2_35_8]OGU38304.1 MAG: hypothetical protein A2X61_03275 [Ignavibacteria bacterium GWB2_35_12]OGU89600.1 MAG: hypothetical protein A2220_11575 [Ignavibacteria bacterium RIFOXYA2_FULL_35_10]OGV20757.1 MAG: hypothetical protein A2475_11270 [Ignavibacteria bacterium RIFOXYC2_FULL_35_21]